MTGEVLLIRPRRFEDDRGWFSETYNERNFRQAGMQSRFVQDNHSLSREKYTLRGLHFQRPPFAQAKLVRCSKGRIFDVTVDIRTGSPSFGGWASVELSAEGGEQLFVPAGFLHGFLTLTPDAEVIYKVSDFYDGASDAGVRWDDPAIAVNWPLPEGVPPTLSAKDRGLPLLAAIDSPFMFQPGDVPLTEAPRELRP
ncbi:dTDP-4-dehydrorhamnose 3,5-epimerase [Rhodomicrobium udaipurense JA643]|uniref:dTDP-4-dehydrorhamnose 3,5-epimerase n=1 Tax=Rhodomicrobium udaipurense TaxID=1202716 RepID=A0A8I1G9C2_9HYPH|nr:dTDP-4-dehydrorhamnose 3,5-epimerase [Rhodomicrobium udaipurense]KAI95763.1 dTDP-4-dehydrorhamnose 3,5-epimerase [Rhodomicrobium udaipurense JA643]MBJ7542943.1 dTDP-4-dehydrorhamnose 3,5-epimerase [Rhodomicrobium udaipurense]